MKDVNFLFFGLYFEDEKIMKGGVDLDEKYSNIFLLIFHSNLPLSFIYFNFTYLCMYIKSILIFSVSAELKFKKKSVE